MFMNEIKTKDELVNEIKNIDQILWLLNELYNATLYQSNFKYSCYSFKPKHHSNIPTITILNYLNELKTFDVFDYCSYYVTKDDEQATGDPVVDEGEEEYNKQMNEYLAKLKEAKSEEERNEISIANVFKRCKYILNDRKYTEHVANLQKQKSDKVKLLASMNGVGYVDRKSEAIIGELTVTPDDEIYKYDRRIVMDGRYKTILAYFVRNPRPLKYEVLCDEPYRESGKKNVQLSIDTLQKYISKINDILRNNRVDVFIDNDMNGKCYKIEVGKKRKKK